MTKDMINHPEHYASGEIECIDAIHEQLGSDGYVAYCQGNVAKYLWRWKSKGGLEDLKKASVYLNWMIEEIEEENSYVAMFQEELEQAAQELAERLDAFSQEHDYYNYIDFHDSINTSEENIRRDTLTLISGSDLIDSYIEGLATFDEEGNSGAKEARKLIKDIKKFKKNYFGKVA